MPEFVEEEFDAFLDCGILARGFLRLRCADCTHERLVAFSCKRRGFCPGCGARRMAETAAHLVDHVIPVFEIDIEQCPQCGGTLKLIAAIEDPPVIANILTHLGLSARAPPRSPARSFDRSQMA